MANVDRVRLAAEALALLEAVRLTDMALDDPATLARAFRDATANDFRRVTKACEEAGEAWEALEVATGGARPEKFAALDGGDPWAKVLKELGDTAMAALLGMQHLLKDEALVWDRLMEAAAKARSRALRSPAVQEELAAREPGLSSRDIRAFLQEQREQPGHGYHEAGDEP